MQNHKELKWQQMAAHFIAEYKRVVTDYDQDDKLISKEFKTILKSQGSTCVQKELENHKDALKNEKGRVYNRDSMQKLIRSIYLEGVDEPYEFPNFEDWQAILRPRQVKV